MSPLRPPVYGPAVGQRDGAEGNAFRPVGSTRGAWRGGWCGAPAARGRGSRAMAYNAGTQDSASVWSRARSPDRSPSGRRPVRGIPGRGGKRVSPWRTPATEGSRTEAFPGATYQRAYAPGGAAVGLTLDDHTAYAVGYVLAPLRGYTRSGFRRRGCQRLGERGDPHRASPGQRRGQGTWVLGNPRSRRRARGKKWLG